MRYYIYFFLTVMLISAFADNEKILDLALELNSKEFKVSQETSFYWSHSDYEWSKNNKTEYTYSDEGLLENATSFFYSSTSEAWKADRITEYFYAEGKITMWTTQVYKETLWENQHRGEYIYDQDAISYAYIYSWSDPEWTVQSRYVYNYIDEFNYNMTGQYPDGSGWKDSYRIIYEKNSAGNIIDYIYQRYEEGEWLNNQRIIYNFRQGKLRDYIMYQWSGSEWENLTWYVYSYDPSDLNYRIEASRWVSSEWRINYKDDNLFDNSLNMIETVRQYYESGSWRNSSKFSYAYIDVSRIDERTPSIPRIFELHQNYPNPFNPETEIAFTISRDADIILTLYNSFGQAVKDIAGGRYFKGMHKILFNAAGLESGTYFLKLQSDGITISRKITFIK
jgi:hypothetical protein